MAICACEPLTAGFVPSRRTAESDGPFGIINVGYTGVTSYADPGGLKLAVINPQ